MMNVWVFQDKDPGTESVILPASVHRIIHIDSRCLKFSMCLLYYTLRAHTGWFVKVTL